MFLSIGTANVDLFLSGLQEMPAMGGDEFTVDNLTFCEEPLTMILGGNGAIFAYVLATLGEQVVLGSAIGSDALGDLIGGWLAEAGVDLSGLVRSRRLATSTTTVVTDRHLNRVSFHYPGPSRTYSPADLPQSLVRETDVLMLASYPLFPRWRPDGFAQLLAQAQQGGTLTALDIGPAIGQPARLPELEPLLPHVDIFLCNEHELAECTEGDDMDVSIRQIADLGADRVIIKRGALGAIAYQKGREPLNVPALDLAAKFTVGAGDSFNAGLLYALKRGWELERALRFGHAVAGHVVSGTQGAMGAPSLDQAMALLADNAT